MNDRYVELLLELKNQTESLPLRDGSALIALRRRTHLLIDTIFDKESKYHSSVKMISFNPKLATGALGSSVGPIPYDRAWNAGKLSFINLVDIMLEDINLSREFSIKSQIKKNDMIYNSDKIFIVHGHNVAILESVARVIEKLGLNPIILNEQANIGNTLIEKFERHSVVGFAIILITDDDEGKCRSEHDLKLRARQNVILELGYFIGKLGRARVLPLYSEGVELPSDIHGLIYTPIDKAKAWQFAIVKELNGVGYNVDAGKLI